MNHKEALENYSGNEPFEAYEKRFYNNLMPTMYDIQKNFSEGMIKMGDFLTKIICFTENYKNHLRENGKSTKSLDKAQKKLGKKKERLDNLIESIKA